MQWLRNIWAKALEQKLESSILFVDEIQLNTRKIDRKERYRQFIRKL